MNTSLLYIILMSVFSSVPADWEDYFTWADDGTFIGLRTEIDFSIWQANLSYALISNETLLVMASQIYRNLMGYKGKECKILLKSDALSVGHPSEHSHQK